MNRISIGVVLVTFNRLGELKKALPCYENQSFKPKYIIVVDNCSTDGTDEFLNEWLKEESVIDKKVISLAENEGGSGGFYAGLKEAQERTDAAWIWVADDDAFPEGDAFKIANDFYMKNHEMMKKCSAFCGMCVDDNKHAATLHQARIKTTIVGKQEIPVNEKEFEKEYFKMDLYSFAGTFLRREALLKAGLPIRDFFIYQDDYEHACRMRKLGNIYCVPGVIIHHNDNYMVKNEVSWRDYYASRNVVMMYKWHFDKYSMWMRILRRFAMVCISFNLKKIKVTIIAIKDGLNEKKGLHSVYKPGWKG